MSQRRMFANCAQRLYHSCSFQRYFMLEKGLIVYGKSGWDVARGKVHGSVDAGLSVIATKPRDGRIDIDAEDCIYHLKVS